MATLSTYRTQVRRLLHDANGNFWSDSDLNDYINEARLDLSRDSGCSRRLQNFTLTTGVEHYSYSDLPFPDSVIDIWGITVIWGNTRYSMLKMSFTQLNAQLRSYISYLSQPVAFANYGETEFYLGPPPDQAYATEVDSIIYIGDLTNDGTTDDIPLVFQTCVKYRAAYLAKLEAQDDKAAEKQLAYYWSTLKQVRAGRALRTIANPYAIGVNRSFGGN